MIRRAIGHNQVMPSGSENLPPSFIMPKVDRRGRGSTNGLSIHRATAAEILLRRALHCQLNLVNEPKMKNSCPLAAMDCWRIACGNCPPGATGTFLFPRYADFDLTRRI